MRALVEGDVVEHIELRLRAEERGVGDTGVAQVTLRLLGDVTRVARVGLACDRVDHVADQRERALAVKGVDLGRHRIRHQEHVGLGDLLKAADRGAVEAEPVAERILVQAGDRQRHVLPGARDVRELQIDHAHAQLLGHLEHVRGTGVGLVCELLDRQRLIAGDEVVDRGLLGCGGHGLVDSSCCERWTEGLEAARPRSGHV